MKSMNEKREKNENALAKWETMTPEERATMKKTKPQEYNTYADMEALNQFLELDFIATVEEEMECSGICQPALFYWEQDIYSGYPTESCAYAMLDFFRDAAGPLKTELRVVATNLLFIFIFHFTLYGKAPKPVDEMDGQEMQSNPNRFELAQGAPEAAPEGYNIQNDVIMEQHEFNADSPDPTP